MRRCGWTRLAGVCSSLRVSDQLSDHYCAEVSSAEVPYALADLVADISDVVEAYPAGSSEPSPRSVSNGNCSTCCRSPVAVSMPSRHGLDGDGDNPYPLPALLSA